MSAPERPAELWHRIQDYIIIYDQRDRSLAILIRQIIKQIKPETVGSLYDETELNTLACTELDLQGKVSSFSVYILLLVTPAFINNDVLNMIKDETIMRDLYQRSAKFIPVFLKPKSTFYELPYGLYAYRGIVLEDRNFKRKVSKLFSCAHFKQQKEQVRARQAQGREKWVKNWVNKETREDDLESEIPHHLLQNLQRRRNIRCAQRL